MKIGDKTKKKVNRLTLAEARKIKDRLENEGDKGSYFYQDIQGRIKELE